MLNKNKKIIILVIISFMLNIILCIITLISLNKALDVLNNKIYQEQIKIHYTDLQSIKGVFDVLYPKDILNIKKEIEYQKPIKIELIELKEKDLGNFKITAYCNCPVCCGKYAGLGKTKTGTTVTANRTIAVDPNIIPLGSKVKINNQEYIAEDTGSKVKGKHIDIYYNTHEEAIEKGLSYEEVILILE